MTFKSFIESEEAEAARLAASTENSLDNYLATLPVTLRGYERGTLIELPTESGQRVVALPLDFDNSSKLPRNEGEPIRHDGIWDCLIIASEHPDYVVNRQKRRISSSQLRRGRHVTL